MRTPDFFILGVQKAGTTTLADLFEATPGLTMTRPKEPMFFCADDMEVQFSNLFRQPSSWQRFDWEGGREALLGEYAASYAHASPEEKVGDGSTTTLLSRRALERIAQTCPRARHLVLLRDPVRRAYSAYWHAIRGGLHAESFETTLRAGRDSLLRYGLYAQHLRVLYSIVPREQVLVLHFEDLARDQAAVWREAVTFLGLPAEPPPKLEETHANAAFYPKSLWLHRQLAGLQGAHNDQMPPVTWLPAEAREGLQAAVSAGKSRAKQLYRQVLMSQRKPAEADPQTVQTLREFYRRENKGLDELVGRDMVKLWGW
ncbi:MAG: sulfotransferase [Verrucomicrobiota bacterium]